MQTKYDKLKNDVEKAKFILNIMNQFQFNYLSKGQKRGTYDVGPWWDNTKIDANVFKLIKPKLKEEVEGSTGGPDYFWSYKDSKNI